MKFDVIVGNPPYANPNRKLNKTALWYKFLHKMIDMNPKTINLLLPPGFLSSSNQMKKLLDKMVVFGLKSIKMGQESKFNVGTDICNIHMERGYSGRITLENKGRVFDFDDNQVFPIKDVSSEGFSICKKFFSKDDKLTFKSNSSCHTLNVANQKTKSDQYCYKNYHRGGQFVYTSKKAPDYNKNKVMVIKSGNLYPIYDNGSMGYTEIPMYHIVNNKDEGSKLIAILNSKLFTYVLRVTKFTGFFEKNTLNKLPYIDYTKVWTDNDLYEHFSLTKKEIDHIEGLCK